jgi:hypothetical protein
MEQLLTFAATASDRLAVATRRWLIPTNAAVKDSLPLLKSNALSVLLASTSSTGFS